MTTVQTPVPTRQTASRAPRGLLLAVLVAAIVLAYVVFAGLTARARANTALQRETLANSIPSVAIVHPTPTAGAEEVVLPGNMQAFLDTPIWARASGYLKAWYVDIGARVKQGQLLAEIEAPEIDQQLQQARANLATDQANLKLAQITAERYANLFKTDSVAKQDVDNAVQSAAAQSATMNSAQANVARLAQLVSYEKVLAPFNGVITARNVDVGALVDADANTAGKELFHLASNATLRVYVNVPEVYSRAAKPGVTAYLTLSEFPARQFHGRAVRNANAIDTSSRTLLVEVDVNNPTGELLPGSYVSVHLKLPSKIEAVTVPVNTLLFRSEGLRVAIVRSGRTALVPVTIGRDFGDTVEVVSGLGRNDSVIVNPSDSLVPGQQVQVGAAQSTE
ncbi:MAG TPA: efflux RND transporter periplasmic adaptor subunit [Bryobacteraceae bacterium]|jgi:RND family efflux transporter MFP subunit|nr:efflux RND transporter periplasmic adaptor subunit [Bryobacteraceae bacterium]